MRLLQQISRWHFFLSTVSFSWCYCEAEAFGNHRNPNTKKTSCGVPAQARWVLHHAEESPALCCLNNYRAANLIWHQHRHTNCSRQLRGTGVNFVGACVHRCTPLRTMITGHRYCSFGWASDSYDLLQVPHKQVPGFEPAPDHFLHIITLSLPSCRLFVLSYQKRLKCIKQ